MSFVNTRFTPATDDALVELNAVLSDRVFIVSNRLTLADLCLYAALSDAVVRCLPRLQPSGPTSCDRQAHRHQHPVQSIHHAQVLCSCSAHIQKRIYTNTSLSKAKTHV